MLEKHGQSTLAKPILILSTIVPPLGFIIFLYLRKAEPKKAMQAMVSALIGIPVSIIMGKYVVPPIFGFILRLL